MMTGEIYWSGGSRRGREGTAVGRSRDTWCVWLEQVLLLLFMRFKSTSQTAACFPHSDCFISGCSFAPLAHFKKIFIYLACCHSTDEVELNSVTPWTAACLASLTFTVSWSLLKLMSIESVMPSNHLILCHPLLLPSIFPSIRVFCSEMALCIKWPK